MLVSEEGWEETFKEGHKITHSPTWREFERKVKMCFFYTPLMTAKHSNTTDLCWRECGTGGDSTHTLWDGPEIQDCWTNIQKEIKLIMGLDLPVDPAI